MPVKIGVVITVVLTVLFNIGCSSEGVFENPDSIEVTTLSAIQGKTGHLVNFTIGKDTTGTTKRAVLALRDKEVSPAALYIVLESGNAGLHRLIDLLKNASDIAIVPDLPENTKPLTRLWLNSGEGHRYAGFLRITASTGTQYLSIRGTLSQERKNWYLREFAKPPTAIYTTPTIIIDEITFDDLNFYIHGDGTNDEPIKRKNNQQNRQDFIGCVFVPKVNRENLVYMKSVRPFSQPLPGVTVTIMSGKRSGESTVTDQNGQYVFQDVQEDALYLLAEKEHFEPKEVIVHRSRQTILANGDVPNHVGNNPQKIPGNILIGQVWPEPIRPLLQQQPVVSDPLFIIADLHKKRGGLYDSGIVVIDKNIYTPHYVAHIANIFAHEIAHMRQHAIVSADGSGNMFSWVHTPEGRAFAEARQKDWNEVGKANIDRIPGFSSLVENAAEICAYYWTGENRRLYENPRVTAPNRFKWAQEWLKKK